MNTNLLYLLLPAACLLIGCSDSKPEAEENTRVPISLMVEGNGVSSATTRVANAWEATLCASTVSNDYALPEGDYEWNRNVNIDADGSVTISPEAYYPSNGDWIFIVGVSPKVLPADGKATYEDATGQSDLLYAKEIRGSRWKAEQFNANKKLDFKRFYTQLSFYAQATDSQIASTLKITKIVLKEVNSKAVITLKDGGIEWSTPADRSLIMDATLTNKDRTLLKTAMLAPHSSYQLEVTSNLGVFGGNVATETDGAFLEGHSHDVTLKFTDTGFTSVAVAVEEWVEDDAGDFDVN